MSHVPAPVAPRTHRFIVCCHFRFFERTWSSFAKLVFLGDAGGAASLGVFLGDAGGAASLVEPFAPLPRFVPPLPAPSSFSFWPRLPGAVAPCFNCGEGEGLPPGEGLGSDELEPVDEPSV